MIPPKKPEPVSNDIIPPTSPANIPALPDIDWAINAANTGTIKFIEYPPTDFNVAAIWLYCSEFGSNE